MGRKLIGAIAVIAAAAASHGQIYSNRSNDVRLPALNALPTSESGVSAGAGAYFSECQHDIGNTAQANQIAGFSGQIVNGNPVGAYRVADDFVVSMGAVTVTGFRCFGFQTNLAGTSPLVLTVSLRVWNGRPGDVGSTILLDLPNAAFTETTTMPAVLAGPNVVDGAIFRIFNSVAPPPGTTVSMNRQLRMISVSLGAPMTFGPGTYWFDWQVRTVNNGNAAFVPSTHSLSRSPLNPLGGGNARQLSAISNLWINAMDEGIPLSAPDVQLEMAYMLDGTCRSYVDPGSLTIDLGVHLGGDETSLNSDDGDELFILGDEFEPITQFTCTLNTGLVFSGTTYAGDLGIELISRATREDQLERLMVWNNSSNSYQIMGTWTTTLAETFRNTIIANAANYVDANGVVKVRVRVVPVADIIAFDGWSNGYEMLNVVCYP